MFTTRWSLSGCLALETALLVTQLCPALCNPMDCSPPGSSVHGILPVLEWVAIPFSRGSPQPRNWTWVSYVAGRFFTVWATREGLKAALLIITILFVSILLLPITIFLTGYIWSWIQCKMLFRWWIYPADIRQYMGLCYCPDFYASFVLSLLLTQSDCGRDREKELGRKESLFSAWEDWVLRWSLLQL